MSQLFKDPANVDDFYFANVDDMRAWLKTLSEAELAVVQRVAYRCRYITPPDWTEGQMDALYAIADGEQDNLMFARNKAEK